MTYFQLYYDTMRRLEQAGIENARFEAGELLQRATGIDRETLLARGEELCFYHEAEELDSLVLRRTAHEPLQYILGEWEFYGLTLAVGEGVLIPRSDTETLVDCAIDLLRDVPEPVVADLCSGSGAIALALWSSLPERSRIYAVELDDRALAFLRENVAAHCGGSENTVEIVRGDVLAPTPLPKLDMIVSNPPYITAADMHTLSPEVQREPELALYGGEDGLDFYRAIPGLYWDTLRSGGWLVLEIGYDQQDSVTAILSECGYKNIGSRCDLGGIVRCIYAQRP